MHHGSLSKEHRQKTENLFIKEEINTIISTSSLELGFDFKILDYISDNFSKPLIFSGGAGNYLHLLEALRKKKIHSIATANLLNFIGNGLQEARELIKKNKIELAEW